MGEVINLRRVRKARLRAAAADTAAANRAAFGRTRHEKETAAAEDTRRAALLDGVRRDGRSPASEMRLPSPPTDDIIG